MSRTAAEQIIEVFDRLIAMGRSAVASRPRPERIVYYVVATRCQIDINGFESVYQQLLTRDKLSFLIEGLRQLEERSLAGQFQNGADLLAADGFYLHLSWNKVSQHVKEQLESIGNKVGSRLWELDDKLVALLRG